MPIVVSPAHAAALRMPVGVMQDRITAILFPAMAALPRLIRVVLHADKILLAGIDQGLLNVVQQVFLIVLHRQHVIAAAVDDLLGDGFLATHRVNGHQGAMQVQQFQQLGNGGDFVGLAIHRQLAQEQVVLAGPGADDMQRPQSLVGAAERRSVLPSMAICLTPRRRRGPASSRESGVKVRGLSRSKTRSKVSWQGMPLGKLQEALQPVAALLAEGDDLLPVLGAQMTAQMAMTIMSISRCRGRGAGLSHCGNRFG